MALRLGGAVNKAPVALVLLFAYAPCLGNHYARSVPFAMYFSGPRRATAPAFAAAPSYAETHACKTTRESSYKPRPRREGSAAVLLCLGLGLLLLPFLVRKVTLVQRVAHPAVPVDTNERSTAALASDGTPWVTPMMRTVLHLALTYAPPSSTCKHWLCATVRSADAATQSCADERGQALHEDDGAYCDTDGNVDEIADLLLVLLVERHWARAIHDEALRR